MIRGMHNLLTPCTYVHLMMFNIFNNKLLHLCLFCEIANSYGSVQDLWITLKISELVDYLDQDFVSSLRIFGDLSPSEVPISVLVFKYF